MPLRPARRSWRRRSGSTSQPQRAETPAWAKGVIYGALGYFIFPLDAIPDVVPVVGYADDLGVLTAALAMVAIHITPEIKEQGRQRLEQWFGPTPEP